MAGSEKDRSAARTPPSKAAVENLGKGAAVVYHGRRQGEGMSIIRQARLGGKLIAHRPIPLGGQPIEAVGYGWSDLPAVLHRHARSGGATP